VLKKGGEGEVGRNGSEKWKGMEGGCRPPQSGDETETGKKEN